MKSGFVRPTASPRPHRLVPFRSRQDALASFVRQSRVQLAELTEQLQVPRGAVAAPGGVIEPWRVGMDSWYIIVNL